MKKFTYTINGIKYSVEVHDIEDNIAEVEVNGTKYSVELEKGTKETPLMRNVSKPKTAPTPVSRPAPAAPVAPVASSAPAEAPASSGGAATPVQSPLPGVVISVNVNVGDSVKKGQKVLVLEAMKMENDIKAPKDGTIASIVVKQGDSLQEGDTLMTIN